MVSALVMMAGKSTRMNVKENKNLLKLNDEYICLISADKLSIHCDEVILVVSKEDYEEVKKITSKYKVILGGNTRQESVYNGLKNVSSKYTIIHDAARPLISDEVLKDVIKSLKEDTAVLVYSKVIDTIRVKENNEFKTLNRDTLVAAKTPQGALTKTLIDVHQKAVNDNYQTTDDIALIEKYTNNNIELVESNMENFKITTMFDYKMAKILIGDKNV